LQRETGLWQDVSELPSSLAATLDARDGVDDVAAVLGSDRVRRVVASGNGAAYYVAVALWLASLESSEGPEVAAAPSGLLARGAFAWREGDVLLAVSSSGEFRDLVEAVDVGVPTPFAAVTATAGSTLGSRADARALVTVEHQRAVTHTQAFCGAVAAALVVWAEVTSDATLAAELGRLPGEMERIVARARGWAEEAGAMLLCDTVVEDVIRRDGKIVGVYGESGRQTGQFNWPHGLACPSETELYVADMNNWRIVKLVANQRQTATSSR